jgi:hypothetical protein
MQQPSYVVWGVRKWPSIIPRRRAKGGANFLWRPTSASKRLDRRKRALARQLFRESSTRDYAGAVEEAIECYGTAKSCVNRHFKQTPAKQLQKFYASRTFKYFPDMPSYFFIDGMDEKERKRTAPEIQSLQSGNLV